MTRRPGRALPRPHARRGGPRQAPGHDPFVVLGLSATPGLTDDDVRAAWRRAAAATHPDRADGGDPGGYAAAAAAYTELRTRYGRGEALAGLAAGGGAGAQTVPAQADRDRGTRPLTGWLTRFPRRITRGRPLRLTLRSAAAAAVAWAALAARAPHGAGPALAAGAMTWLIVTGRHDLTP